MRQRFFPQTLIVCLCLTLFTTLTAQAQETYIPITAQNSARISQVERIGNGVPRALTFSADGKRLAIATTLGVWMIDEESQAGEQCRVFQQDIGRRCRLYEDQGGAESLAFSPDGKLLVDGGDDNSVMVWEVGSGGAVARMENHIYPVSAVAWSSDGKWIASGDWSGVVRIWDTSNWSEYRVLSTTGKIDMLQFNDISTELTAYHEGDYTIWEIASSSDITPVARVARVKINDDLVAATNDSIARYATDTGQINISDSSGNTISNLDCFYGELSGVFFTSDGRVGASPLKSSYLWSLNGKPDNQPPPVLSPDRSRLATFGNDGVIHLKDAKTGNEIAALHGHIRAVTDVAFSPDSRLLVSSSNDGTIQIWDATLTQDSGSLATLTGHNGGVSSVAFNADGTLIASSGYDGTARLWGIKG
jgi:WD40 repeat protein